jgi:hypothetical protein
MLFCGNLPIAAVLRAQQPQYWCLSARFSADRGWNFGRIRVIGAHLLIARRERQDGNIAAYALSMRDPASGDLARVVPFLS